MMEREAARIANILARIGIDSNAASELLTVASEYLARCEPMPKPLSEFLAHSFDLAMQEPSGNRANALVFHLGLTAPAKVGAPPKEVDYDEVRAIVESEFAGGRDPSEAEIKRKVGKRFGVSSNTAAKHVKPAMLVPKLLRHNGLDSLIPQDAPKVGSPRKSSKKR